MHDHLSHGASFPWLTAVVYLVLAGLWVTFLYGVHVQKERHRCWSPWRTFSWSAGIVAIAIALYPPLMHGAHIDFRLHMVVHLLLGMLAPLGLVLAAPVTLAIRTLPTSGARRLIQVLSFPLVQFISHPVAAMLLNVGAMYVLYMTPLYGLTLHSGWVSAFVHWHFLAAGYLFVWSIAGPDHAPGRPNLRFRLGVLFVSLGAHATLGKVMYVYGWPRNSPHDLEQIQAGAQLMYYGGNIAELILIIAFFALWFRQTTETPHSERRLSRSRVSALTLHK